jgi:HPt (histidine-containing phosphotransfer) domain-containing protein
VVLYSSLGADPDLGELVEMFVDEMPDRVDHLLEQFQASNWDGLYRAAHQIKGAAGSYGFHQLTPTATELEAAVRDHQPEQEILASLNALIDMCRRVRAGTQE